MEAATDFETLFGAYPAHVQEIAAALRDLIFRVLPEPLEIVDGSSKLAGYGFGRRYADLVCTLIPSKGGVKLGLANGASLSDPQHLLAGEGKVHRHVNFKSLADVRRPGVRALLRAALAAQQSRAKSAKR